VSEWQTILGNPPSKSNCYRIITIGGHGSLAKTKALKKYEDDFFIQCDKYRNKNIDEYFEFHVRVFYPSQRADLDNSLKCVLDCLQKCKAISNDNKCTRIVAEKFLDKERPRIEFMIQKSAA
jgi:Holliday junction resolvase RusA-like endonuclease